MPKIDIEAIPQSNATGYPAPFNDDVKGRWWRRLAPAGWLDPNGCEPCGPEARGVVIAAALARSRGRDGHHAVRRGGVNRG